jgi:hypothetical protein
MFMKTESKAPTPAPMKAQRQFELVCRPTADVRVLRGRNGVIMMIGSAS